jgi:hypothetical protein
MDLTLLILLKTGVRYDNMIIFAIILLNRVFFAQDEWGNRSTNRFLAESTFIYPAEKGGILK